MLVEVAHRLRWELADCEIVARVGEDEFGVLIDSASPDAIEEVANRIHACIASPVVVDAVRVAVSVSIGAATLGKNDRLRVGAPSGRRRALGREGRARTTVAVRIHEPGYEARDDVASAPSSRSSARASRTARCSFTFSRRSTS